MIFYIKKPLIRTPCERFCRATSLFAGGGLRGVHARHSPPAYGKTDRQAKCYESLKAFCVTFLVL